MAGDRLLVEAVGWDVWHHRLPGCGPGLFFLGVSLAKLQLDANLQDMITRILQEQVQQRLGESPGVALVGPRQCGKTTLARFLGGVYLDLE